MATTQTGPVSRPVATHGVGVARPVPWRKYLLWLLLSLGALVMILPFYWTLVTSFKPQVEIGRIPPTLWPESLTLEHWESLGNLPAGNFLSFFRNSLFVATATTAVTLLTSSAAGYVFAKLQFRGRDKLFLVILAMMLIPFNITLIPSYALMVDLGWTNNYLALIVPIAFNPFGIFLMRQFMHGIPNELLDAARMDGANEFQIFVRIIIPLSAAGLAALGIFTFIASWDHLLWPLVVIDDPELWTLPLGLAQFRGRTGVDVGALCAAAMLAVIPTLAVYLVAQRRFIEGIALSGTKG